MREFSIEEGLKKTLKKLVSKDRDTYSVIARKMDEILNSEDVSHYKNLRAPLQDFKRVHIKGPFVLTFIYIESEDKIVFYDFDHHNSIYKR